MLDLPAIKKRADFAVKNYNRLGSSWAEFYGRDVPQLVEELEEAQKASEEYENRWIAAQGKLDAVGEWKNDSWEHDFAELARILKGEW